MKTDNKKRKRIVLSEVVTGTVSPDSSSDRTGTDIDSDKTQSIGKKKVEQKFDKPKREVDPDTTGIDIYKEDIKPGKTSQKTSIKTESKKK